MQGSIVHAGGREVILVLTEVPYSSVVGSHIHCIRRDGHWIREATCASRKPPPRKGGHSPKSAPELLHRFPTCVPVFGALL